jgi:hypothetical protein
VGGDDEGPRRLCAVTRAELAREDLIRFVAAPSGEIVPDLANRLPGRGVWLRAEKDVVLQAVRMGVFARSLRRPVTVDGDLADRVEALMVRRLTDALALANKAGAVVTGFAQVLSLIEEGAAAALVHGQDAAGGGQDKLDRKLKAIARDRGRSAPIVTSLSTAHLSLAMGRSNVVHAALIQGGATERFLREAERLERYRSGLCASGSVSSAKSTEV